MFALENVIPWGRSFDEYRRMFALDEADLRGRILGCADGPASFNAELTGRGGRAVSCDPLYRFNAEEIRKRIDESYTTVMEQLRQNRDDYVWDERIASVEELGSVRMTAMRRFLNDFQTGKKQGRYIDAELPRLPFEPGEFDLALCSHFLFLYSERISERCHLESIIEMCRVAGECRIFPLIDLGGQTSRHLAPVCDCLRRRGMTTSIERVDYEFFKGANEMLRVVAVETEETQDSIAPA